MNAILEFIRCHRQPRVAVANCIQAQPCKQPQPQAVTIAKADSFTGTNNDTVRIPSKAELQNMMICGTSKSFWDDQNQRQAQYYKLGNQWVFESKDAKTPLILKTNRCGQAEWQPLSDSEKNKLQSFKNRPIELEAKELDASKAEDAKEISRRLNYSDESVAGLGKMIFDKDDQSHPMLVRGNAEKGYKFFIHDRKADGKYDWIEVDDKNYPRHLQALNARYPKNEPIQDQPAGSTEPLPAEQDQEILESIMAAEPIPPVRQEPIKQPATAKLDFNGQTMTVKEGGVYDSPRPFLQLHINKETLGGASFISSSDKPDSYILTAPSLYEIPEQLIQFVHGAEFRAETYIDDSVKIEIPKSAVYLTPTLVNGKSESNGDPFQ